MAIRTMIEEPIRKLLKEVSQGSQTPEYAAAIIMDWIDEYYDIKTEVTFRVRSTPKKFHEAVQKALNSPWLYDNITDIKDEYYKQVRLFLKY